jgi:hypothetical protein
MSLWHREDAVEVTAAEQVPRIFCPEGQRPKLRLFRPEPDQASGTLRRHALVRSLVFTAGSLRSEESRSPRSDREGISPHLAAGCPLQAHVPLLRKAVPVCTSRIFPGVGCEQYSRVASNAQPVSTTYGFEGDCGSRSSPRGRRPHRPLTRVSGPPPWARMPEADRLIRRTRRRNGSRRAAHRPEGRDCGADAPSDCSFEP